MVSRIVPPEPARSILRNGGLVDGTVSLPNPGRFGGLHYVVAHAAFNVVASEAGGQILVWATAWDNAAPEPGANVEILHAESPTRVTLIAHGITDSSGVAVIDRPIGDALKGHEGLLVRVSRGARSATMPLTEALPNTHGRDDIRSPLDEREKISWGVADKPLYRAGETVHYRVWVRQRHLNHLGAIAGTHTVELTARAQYGETEIGRFTVTLDAFGSATGDIVLPTTLRDDTYCLGTSQNNYGTAEGVCFKVASHHVNDLWAELVADRAVVRDGDVIALRASAGYYSGGSSAGTLAEFQSLLTPLPLEDAYPAFREFTFVDPFQNTVGFGGVQLTDARLLRGRTDSHGEIAVRVPLTQPPIAERYADDNQRPIPFGNAEFVVSMSNSANSYAMSTPAVVRYARYPRFVGIKTNSWTLKSDADPQVDAVVISADGQSIAGAPVHVALEAVEGDETTDAKSQPLVVAQCDLSSGSSIACPFRPTHSGVYRFRASSPDAAETVLDRYAFLGDQVFSDEHKERAKLSISNKSIAAGSVADVMLEQPFAKAKVLMTVEHGQVLDHWVVDMQGPSARIAITIKASWAPGASIHATILDAADKAFGKAAVAGTLVETATLDLEIAGTQHTAALSMKTIPDRAEPGSDVTVVLKNISAKRTQVTLAVVDDAARALVPDIVAALDPHSNEWLGRLVMWRVPEWYALGAWPRQVGAGHGSATSVFDFGVGGGSLETIVVTGSNIRAADIFVRGNASDHSLGRALTESVAGEDELRHRFAEAALWKTDIILDAGGDVSTNVHLPDNLTRWRVLAWSVDEGDEFSLTQQTLESSLPLEVRTQAPTRLFPGDIAAIAAQVHSHGAPSQIVTMSLSADGAGTHADAHAVRNVEPNGQQSVSLDAKPTAVGQINVAARARTTAARDGVAAVVDVESPVIHERAPVAGWLPSEGVHLKVPDVSAGARNLSMHITVGRGLMPLAVGWVEALRDYPHRCWEQILSRAVGAAASKKLGLSKDHWKEADAVVNDALRAAGQFQDTNGEFYFFSGTYNADVFPPSAYLTAYTLQSLKFLRSLGYDIPADVEKKAKTGLEEVLHTTKTWRTTRTYGSPEERAAVVAALVPDAIITPSMLDELWDNRGAISWHARVRLAEAWSADGSTSDRIQQLMDELRTAGTRHGMQRVLASETREWSPFVSTTLDQCSAIDALRGFDHHDDAEDVRVEFVRGLADLYAGGAPLMDTQASAQCLMMLARELPEKELKPIDARISALGATDSVLLNADSLSIEWNKAFASLPSTVDVHAIGAEKALLSFVADVAYDVDGRTAKADAVGFSLSRRYSVLRDQHWLDVDDTHRVVAGDWVRVTLRIATSARRRFVAVSDTVPGGLFPANFELAGVSDLALTQLGAEGSPYFYERQVDDRRARFYAEQVPPGVHDIVYYARAAAPGRYAALPAVAGLMYGRASVARTNASQIVINKSVERQP